MKRGKENVCVYCNYHETHYTCGRNPSITYVGCKHPQHSTIVKAAEELYFVQGKDVGDTIEQGNCKNFNAHGQCKHWEEFVPAVVVPRYWDDKKECYVDGEDPRETYRNNMFQRIMQWLCR